jgi:hypothetical protein
VSDPVTGPVVVQRVGRGIAGLPVSRSPTLFTGSGPVGLSLFPWTEETIEREVGRAKDLPALRCILQEKKLQFHVPKRGELY